MLFDTLTELGVSPEDADEIAQACRGDPLLSHAVILLRQGYNRSEIAERLGVRQQRISEAFKTIQKQIDK